MKVLEDTDNPGTLFNSYGCGQASKHVDVHYHGVNHAVWTLADYNEKHLYGDKKANTKACLGCLHRQLVKAYEG